MLTVAEAEQRVMTSRRELRLGVSRLRTRLTQPPILVAALAVGALLAFVAARRGRASALAGPLAMALLLRGVDYLLSRASTPKAAPPTPSP
jgi:hypothetical protein